MKKKFTEETVCEPVVDYNLGLLLKDGVQGKYVQRYREGTNVVLLEPDIARAFPTPEAVNAALRLVMQLSSLTRPRKTRPVHG
jgi:hypothetical protein